MHRGKLNCDMEKEELIPEHEEGAQSNTEAEAQLGSEEEARQFFQTVKKRLLDVNHWQEYAGVVTAKFQLTDENGNALQRAPRTGDYFRIDIPGPGTITGGGDDWVQVEDMDEDEDCAGIRVRPASNPTNERKDVAHFFHEGATSSFIVRREGAKVFAGVYGRNEKPNVKTETVVDKIRNAAVATGAAAAFSKLQWKSLVKGLIKKRLD